VAALEGGEVVSVDRPLVADALDVRELRFRPMACLLPRQRVFAVDVVEVAKEVAHRGRGVGIGGFDAAFRTRIGTAARCSGSAIGGRRIAPVEGRPGAGGGGSGGGGSRG